MPLIAESTEIINRIGREEAMGMVDNSDEEDDEEGHATGTTSGTVVRPKRNLTGTSSSSTMVISEEEASGTMKVGTTKVVDSNYVPPFMAHIKQQQQEKEQQKGAQQSSPQTSRNATLTDSRSSPDIPKRNPKYANLSTEEVKKKLNDLESKMEKDLEAIRAKYASKRKDLETIIQKKKLQDSTKKK